MRLIITHRMWDSKYGYAPIPDIGVMPIRPRIVRTTLVKVSRYAKSNAYFTQVSRAGYAQRSRRSRRACRRRLARRRSSPMCFAPTLPPERNLKSQPPPPRRQRTMTVVTVVFAPRPSDRRPSRAAGTVVAGAGADCTLSASLVVASRAAVNFHSHSCTVGLAPCADRQSSYHATRCALTRRCPARGYAEKWNS